MSVRTDTEREARVKLWKTIALAVILIVIGVNDMGLEAFAFGSICLLTGASLNEACERIGEAMDAEERE